MNSVFFIYHSSFLMGALPQTPAAAAGKACPCFLASLRAVCLHYGGVRALHGF